MCPLCVNICYIFNRDKELQFVGTQNTISNFEGWLQFNITNALISWISFSYPNRGLYISVRSLDNEGNFNNNIFYSLF